ncbi:PhaM family polyhydroxyalkanoate granule multifunctional regulatory protein [Pulveribacter suum]|uniref:Uncharacterized protein n=1 Tax=Pulveribacter suum TaxID=2116657 RepID=A0A2P1NI97_9BURK|nr:PhaM family polyhydroxyalkanoate granule multifunctional regulatory protein [Pulveribacter suum]AVP56798.1 hypothetical protein C7H73_03330 [Pulveribacter suum]
MSDNSPFGFARFVPGFDFLQSLAKGAAGGMPGLPGWVAPTASVQELDRRIQELKAVQFWLEQNARALTATVQALEVQKMTLATLAGMNVAVGDVAAALGGMGAAAASPAPAPAAPPRPAPQPQPAPQGSSEPAGAAPGAADPLQWWGALTHQFQQIAAHAMQDAATQQAAFDATRDMAGGAFKTASDMATQWAQAAGGDAAAPASPGAGRAATATAAEPAAGKKAAAKKSAKKQL